MASGYEPLGAMKAWGSKGSGCELLQQPQPQAKPGSCVPRRSSLTSRHGRGDSRGRRGFEPNGLETCGQQYALLHHHQGHS